MVYNLGLASQGFRKIGPTPVDYWLSGTRASISLQKNWCACAFFFEKSQIMSLQILVTQNLCCSVNRCSPFANGEGMSTKDWKQKEMEEKTWALLRGDTIAHQQSCGNGLEWLSEKTKSSVRLSRDRMSAGAMKWGCLNQQQMNIGRGVSSCPMCGSGDKKCSKAWLEIVKWGAVDRNMTNQQIRLAQIGPCNPETLKKSLKSEDYCMRGKQ